MRVEGINMTVFNAYSRYYDLLYRDKDYAGEAQYVRELIVQNAPHACSVLDLGCGTGRHDLLLAQLGYQVTGVDRSEEMLAVAASRLSSHPGHLPSVAFVHGDIRTVRLGRTFDAVVSLFHVMSYQTGNDDLAAAVATARAHLSPGGVFIFDCWYGPAVLTDRPAVRVKRLEDESIVVTRIAEPALHENDNQVEVDYQVFIRSKETGMVNELHETHRMRYLFHPEVSCFLEEAGMEIVSAGEWLTGRRPGFDTWGVCYVARVKGEG